MTCSPGTRMRKPPLLSIVQRQEMGAYQYATIYAQWGDHAKALEWLDVAMRLRDPGLENLKTDPLVGPLRQEPRLQAAMRALKSPD
jgi:hypothetical protein